MTALAATESAISTDQLKERICSRASLIAAETCEWLLDIAEFDRRGEWGWGIKSVAHWLNLRCGVSLSTGYEYVRVARALEHVPRVRAEFAAARLSYSKVRAITRAVTDEVDEDVLLNLAIHGTAAQLEDVAREFVRRDRADDVMKRLNSYRLTRGSDDDGTYGLKLKLAPEDGATLDAALDLAAEMFYERQPEDTRPDPACSLAQALVGIMQAWLEHAKPPTTARSPREVLVLVDEQTVAEFLDERAQPSTQLAITGPNGGCSRWARKRGRARLMGRAGLRPKTAERLMCDGVATAMILDQAGTPLDVGRKTRRINSRLRAALRVRDADRCRAPGCHARVRLHAHHIRPWQYGGETKLENLILLCSQHHTLVHEGRWTIAIRGRNEFAFHDDLGNKVLAGMPLPAYAGRILPRKNVDGSLNAKDGTRMDRRYVLDVLLRDREMRRARARAALAGQQQVIPAPPTVLRPRLA